MLMSLEVGIGVGAVFSGYQFQGDLSAISSLYAIAGGLGLFGLVVLLIFRGACRTLRRGGSCGVRPGC